jgi:maleylacetoacetate isomerase
MSDRSIAPHIRRILYSRFIASSPYRVRIALALKGLEFEYVGVNLQQGEQYRPEFLALNPQGLVPALQDGDALLTQSLAIIEYLEERYPTPPLLPGGALDRARIRAMALVCACEIHPLNNLSVLNYLKGPLQLSAAAVDEWYRHWVSRGLAALESLVRPHYRDGQFCYGAQPTLADVVLVPQMNNARRFQCDLTPYPLLTAIDARCRALPAFAAAAPERQPDAPRA